MEGHCSTGQRPQWAVVPMEEEEEKEEEEGIETVIIDVFIKDCGNVISGNSP